MTNFGTMNKVVSLFIVGGLLLALTVGFFLRVFLVTEEQRSEITGWLSNTGPAGAVFGTLSLLGVAALFGTAAQGLAGVIIRKSLPALIEKDWFARCVFQFGMREEVRIWKKHFFQTAGRSRIFSSLTETLEASRRADHLMPLLARALFFRQATPHTFEWVLQHYSTYYLATDVGLVAMLSTLWSFAEIFCVKGSIGLPLALFATQVVLLYACICLATHRYLYSYRALLREATVYLILERNEDGEGSSPKASAVGSFGHLE